MLEGVEERKQESKKCRCEEMLMKPNDANSRKRRRAGGNSAHSHLNDLESFGLSSTLKKRRSVHGGGGEEEVEQKVGGSKYFNLHM